MKQVLGLCCNFVEHFSLHRALQYRGDNVHFGMVVQFHGTAQWDVEYRYSQFFMVKYIVRTDMLTNITMELVRHFDVLQHIRFIQLLLEGLGWVEGLHKFHWG